MRILVVEDTEDLADAIIQRLRKHGYASIGPPTGIRRRNCWRARPISSSSST